jgi:hypothetical protein
MREICYVQILGGSAMEVSSTDTKFIDMPLSTSLIPNSQYASYASCVCIHHIHLLHILVFTA